MPPQRIELVSTQQVTWRCQALCKWKDNECSTSSAPNSVVRLQDLCRADVPTSCLGVNAANLAETPLVSMVQAWPGSMTASKRSS